MASKFGLFDTEPETKVLGYVNNRPPTALKG